MVNSKNKKITMKRYQPLFPQQILLTESELVEYNLYCKWVVSSNYGERLVEWSLPTSLKSKISFIKDLAVNTGLRLKDLFKLFMEKYVFKFFEMIGWSFQKLFDLLKMGYKAYQDLQKTIAEYLHDKKIVDWTKAELEKLDKFLAKNPKVKKIAGVVVAGLLVYIWLNMSFTGDFIDDFDISLVFLALAGKSTLMQIFGTSAGTKMLVLFATGMLMGLSFPWPGSNLVKFSIAIVTSLGLYFKQKIGKGSTKDAEKDLQAVGG